MTLSLRTQMRYMNPYDLHKLLINEYILKRPGDTNFLKRDNSKDKTDYDVIKENHRFLWEDEPDTWEDQFAKKYYDKLFKEYCIGDLTQYKENKIALRWRIEKEVVSGKGQFICGNKHCPEDDGLRTWEVNFAYQEKGEKKNALVKIRLCPDCSSKLNYRTKKREIKRLKKSKKEKCKEKDQKSKLEESTERVTSSVDVDIPDENEQGTSTQQEEESPWEVSSAPAEQKSRDDEMEEYLQDLLL